MIFSGASAERQIIFENMAERPIPWFYAFLTQELGYEHNMVVALLKRSFVECTHEIVMADEDAEWNSESMTVTTANAKIQSQVLEQNMSEGLHLSVSELIQSRNAVDAGTARAELFRQKGFHPEAEIPTDHQNNDALSTGTGVSHDASTANSELTYSFNDNRMKKYVDSKMQLAESTATIASQSRKMDKQTRLIEQLQKRMQKMQSDKSNNIDTNSSSSRSIEIDVIEHGNHSATYNDDDSDSDSEDYSSSSDSNISSIAARQESSQYEEIIEDDTSLNHRTGQDPPSQNTSDDDSKSRDY